MPSNDHLSLIHGYPAGSWALWALPRRCRESRGEFQATPDD